MASMTRSGTWVPPGPSRKAAGCPATVWEREGNCERMEARGKAGCTDCSLVSIRPFIFITVANVGDVVDIETSRGIRPRPATIPICSARCAAIPRENGVPLGYRSHEIGNQAVRRGVQARTFFGDGQAGE